jgi:hypothetical protein
MCTNRTEGPSPRCCVLSSTRRGMRATIQSETGGRAHPSCKTQKQWFSNALHTGEISDGSKSSGWPERCGGGFRPWNRLLNHMVPPANNRASVAIVVPLMIVVPMSFLDSSAVTKRMVLSQKSTDSLREKTRQSESIRSGGRGPRLNTRMTFNRD